MSAYRVLHLSDLHIGGTYLPTLELAYKISGDINQKGFRGFRKVLVTGDIFNGPSGCDNSLIQEAVAFFRTLMNELNGNGNATNLTVNDFLFVPGNHDMVWFDNVTDRWKKYQSFLKEFYGDIPDFYDLEDFSFAFPCPEEKLVFLGFNSCGLEKKQSSIDAVKYCESVDTKTYQAQGIDKTKLINLLNGQILEKYEDYGEISSKQLSKQHRKMISFEGYQSVALFHHHFFLFPDVSKGVADSDVIRNHSSVVRGLRSMEVKTILHGHKHFDWERPFIDEDYYKTTDSIIDVFAGGSAGCQKLQQHSFNIIDFFPQKDAIKLRQSKFIYREDALDIKAIQIPPVYTPTQIVKLLELLASQDNDAYEKYQKIIMSNLHIYQACVSIITWIGNALTGYAETYRHLNRDSNYLLCILCAVAGRAIAYIGQHNPEEKNSLANTKKQLFDFFSNIINADQMAKYRELFELSNLNQTATRCNKLLEETRSPHSRRQTAFVMVGIFFTDLNLVLKEYADDFYKQISHKVNVKLEPSKFHFHVPAVRIELQADPDRRSAYIKMWCGDATAHKLAVLFVKEFDLIINKFEDFFKLIDLKLYYLLPKIEKDASLDALDNYNFEAYIPSLLPLLIGDKIYHSKKVFARELIQNSIDAISVREAMAENCLDEEARTILIDLGHDENGRRFFKITDCGTGMDRYKVERYFTSIGRSFYSGDDYEELNISYKPISSFGIGFLSSFMVCSEIDVRTCSFDGVQEGLKLHIPNYEGCFFIERDESAKVGTEIKLYLDDSVSDNEIIKYIGESMVDIRYNIVIMTDKITSFPAHRIRLDKPMDSVSFFVPFLDNGDVGHPDWQRDVLSGNIINTSEYGLLINMIPPNKEHITGCFSILNAGIHTMPLSSSALFGELKDHFMDPWSSGYLGIEPDYLYNQFVFNFPSNWIQIDVSREKIVGYSTWMEKQFPKTGAMQHVRDEITKSLEMQIENFLDFSRKNGSNIPAVNLEEVIRFLRRLTQKESMKSLTDRYSLRVLVKEYEIKYCLFYNPEKVDINISYEDDSAKSRAKVSYNLMIQSIQNNMSHNPKSKKDKKRKEKIASTLQNLLMELRRVIIKGSPKHHYRTTIDNIDLSMLKMTYLGVCTLIVMNFTDLENELFVTWQYLTKSIIMNDITIGDAELKETWISVSYENIDKLFPDSLRFI